jgi:FG-GAP repeat
LVKGKIAILRILMQEHTLFNHTQVNSSLTRSYPQHNKVPEDGSHAKRKRSVATQQISGFPASFDLTTLNGANGFIVNGISSGDGLGELVSTAGDMNGDGKDDLVVAAPRASYYAGVNYVIFQFNTVPVVINPIPDRTVMSTNPLILRYLTIPSVILTWIH